MPSPPKLTIDEFFEALSNAEERQELVGGFVRLLAHANQGQNVVRSNVLTALAPASRQEGYPTKLDQSCASSAATLQNPRRPNCLASPRPRF